MEESNDEETYVNPYVSYDDERNPILIDFRPVTMMALGRGRGWWAKSRTNLVLDLRSPRPYFITLLAQKKNRLTRKRLTFDALSVEDKY